MKKLFLATILLLMCIGTSAAKQVFLTCDPYPATDNLTSFTVQINGATLPAIAPVKDIDYPANGSKTGGWILWVEITSQWINGLNKISAVANSKYGSSAATLLEVNATLPAAPGLRCIMK